MGNPAMTTRTTGWRAATRFAAMVGLAAVMTGGPGEAAELAQIFAKHTAGAKASVDHAAWSQMLEKYVKPGADGLNRVDYKRFKAESHDALKRYVGELEKVDPGKLDKAEQFAYWANLYNAKTIDVVLDKYPVDSIRNITLGGGGLLGALKSSVGAGGPWKAKIMTVAGYGLSLDDIEHGILRPVFKDARVHYAVNCASIGCPNLGTEAFTGAKLEVQLDAGAVAYVNHPRGISVDGGKVKASNIYNWFAVDFGGTAQSVLAHARRYAKPELKAKLEGATRIDSYDYDWALNDYTAK